MNIVLIGMKHCGKSTLGAALAARRGWAFVDVDAEIERAFAAETGERLSVREIYRRHGPETFRRLEGQVVEHLAAGRTGPEAQPCVIAVGGQTAINPASRGLLRQLGLVVYLQVDGAELFRRVQAGGLPPFLDPARPEAHFHEIHQQRRPLYEQQADLTVNLDRLTPAEALAVVLERIEEHPHAR